MRNTVREYLVTEVQNGPNEPNDTDEEILNIIRGELQKSNGVEYLTTGEIADSLSIQSTQTGNRLNDLLQDNRVEKRRAGQTDMWTLSPSETRTVVEPQLTHFAKSSGQLRRLADTLRVIAKDVVVSAFILMLLAVSNPAVGLPLPGVDWDVVLAVGYLLGMAGGILFSTSAIFALVGQHMPTVAKLVLLE